MGEKTHRLFLLALTLQLMYRSLSGLPPEVNMCSTSGFLPGLRFHGTKPMKIRGW